MTEATAADSDEVIALWQACGLTRPWNDPVADFSRAVEGPASAVLLHRDEGRLKASVMVGSDGHRGWVYYLAVTPEARRQGFGRAMMAEAEAWLRARGAPKLQLMVRDGNADALAFYESLGLKRQGVITMGRFLA